MFLLFQNLALDRILEIEPSKEKYEWCTIDFNEYFEDIIGVSHNLEAEPELIRIQLSENIIPYI